MRNKILKISSKAIIVLILALMVFAPNLLVSKASSYSYDFWKNVIPSAEGLAYRDTYYYNDIKDINGEVLTGDKAFKFDTLTDLATYNKQIYVLDSKKNAATTVQGKPVETKDGIKYEAFIENGSYYPVISANSVSTVYILNENFQLVEAISEILITDEIKNKLDEYYDFDKKLTQITTENLVATELKSFYTTSSLEYTLAANSNELVIRNNESGTPEFILATYHPATATQEEYLEYSPELEIALWKNGTEKIDNDLWQWTGKVVDDKVVYSIVLDESLKYSKDQTIKIELKTPTIVGKAPYFAYSKDTTKAAIRLDEAAGVTVTSDGLYIADSGNARIIRANKNSNGEWVVDRVYLTPNDLVFYQVSSGDTLVNTTESTLFDPQKIAVDQTGRVYCIARNVYEGIMEFHSSGSFNRFLGKNEVVANPLKKFWSKIFSEAQITSLNPDLPPEFTNIAVDADGFLFATSKPDENDTAAAKMVKMINTSGLDIMKRNGYVTPDGDAVYLSTSTEEGVVIGPSSLVGVTISEKNNNFTVVDQARGRLFTYDNEGNLLYITGDQPGGINASSSGGLSNSIIEPTAIRYFYRNSGEVDENGNPIEEEVLLVLDNRSKSILLFQTTEFGEAVNIATELYQNGIVEDIYTVDDKGNKELLQAGAETYWREVVKMNTNYELAYLGIGKALHRRGEYKEAMEYFKLAHNATYYSKAYMEYRDIILTENFNWIMTGFIMLIVLWMTMKYRKHLKQKNLELAAQAALNEEKAKILSGNITGIKHDDEIVEDANTDAPVQEEVPEEEKESVWQKIKKALKVFYKEVVKHPLYLLSHPIQGFTEFKLEKKGKTWVAWTIILLYVLMNIISYQYEGIITNTNNPQEFNSILILIYGVLPPVLIAVANWSVTTLLDGKGKIGEIFKMIGYSLFPVVMFGFFNIILSNVLTLDEAQFVMLINIIAWVLTCYMVFMGLIVIHEYGMGKTLLSVIFTVVALLIIAFVALLIFDLAQQMYGFVYSLYQEISMRFF